jgi:hypothetical protein
MTSDLSDEMGSHLGTIAAIGQIRGNETDEAEKREEGGNGRKQGWGPIVRFFSTS